MIIQNKPFLDEEITLKDDDHGFINLDDLKYIGEVKNNYMNGYGKLWKDNMSYHGKFLNNNLEGFGTLKVDEIYNSYSNSIPIYYKGNFVNGNKCGEGYEKYKNGEYYIGNFKFNLRNGDGKLFNKNGKVKIEGHWENGKSLNTSYISLFHDNSNLYYKGEYDGEKKNGMGVECDIDGKIVFDGLFKDDNYVKGKLYYNNALVFEGKFIDNVPSEGTLYSEQANKLCDGIFKLKYEDKDYDEIVYNLYLYGKGIVYYDDKNESKLFEGEFLENICNSNFDTKLCTPPIVFKINNKHISININYGSGVTYYENGDIKYSLNINSDTSKMIGENITYYKSNRLRSVSNYDKDGKLFDISKTYFECGSCDKHITYVNNKAEYLVSHYVNNDKILYEGECSSTYKYHGDGKLYYNNENNTIKYEGKFAWGKMCGNGTFKNDNNVVVYSGSFDNGHKNGEGTSYYVNGQVEYIGEWVNGEKHGQGTLYDEDGQIVYAGIFNYDNIS